MTDQRPTAPEEALARLPEIIASIHLALRQTADELNRAAAECSRAIHPALMAAQAHAMGRLNPDTEETRQ